MPDPFDLPSDWHLERHIVKIDVGDAESIFRTIKVPVGPLTTAEEIQEYIDDILSDWESEYESTK